MPRESRKTTVAVLQHFRLAGEISPVVIDEVIPTAQIALCLEDSPSHARSELTGSIGTNSLIFPVSAQEPGTYRLTYHVQMITQAAANAVGWAIEIVQPGTFVRILGVEFFITGYFANQNEHHDGEVTVRIGEPFLVRIVAAAAQLAAQHSNVNGVLQKL